MNRFCKCEVFNDHMQISMLITIQALVQTTMRIRNLQGLPFIFQGGLGPMQGQAHHFVRYAPEQIEYAKNRYISETDRLYKVLESRLSTSKWLAADKYTIADIANYSWLTVSFMGCIRRSHYPKVQVTDNQ